MEEKREEGEGRREDMMSNESERKRGEAGYIGNLFLVPKGDVPPTMYLVIIKNKKKKSKTIIKERINKTIEGDSKRYPVYEKASSAEQALTFFAGIAFANELVSTFLSPCIKTMIGSFPFFSITLHRH